jgi:hypothetical protein
MGELFFILLFRSTPSLPFGADGIYQNVHHNLIEGRIESGEAAHHRSFFSLLVFVLHRRFLMPNPSGKNGAGAKECMSWELS